VKALFTRNSELGYLNASYDRSGSQIIVLYGQKNIGKHDLLKTFIADKPSRYYYAVPASDRELRFQWGADLASDGIRTFQYPEYREIFHAMSEKGEGKLVIIIDEFTNLIKSGRDFITQLVEFVHDQWSKREVFVVLVSSSVGWVENSLVSHIGEFAYEISGFLKVGPLSFDAMSEYFHNFSREECIETYAVLGGYPGLWEAFDDSMSVKDNICNAVLKQTGPLYNEGTGLIEAELRETAVYSTILASIAAGSHKLNDLYEHTGFSRAKISVYIKNLMELGLVEKVFSYDTAGKANTQKGIYGISNHFLNFYFTFIYPNMSMMQMHTPAEFYSICIAPAFRHYVSPYFRQVCSQYMSVMNNNSRLPFKYDKSGVWVGKDGTIDLVAQSEKGRTVICLCNWDKPMMTFDEFDGLMHNAKQARIKPEYVYLFSANRFDEKLNLEAKVKKNLRLVRASEMQI
jgi:AAA+ ATPase superfamily predicted ATPase